MFRYKINGRVFSSAEKIVTGQEILNVAGFDSDTKYEIFLRKGRKELEPIQLDEEVDLSQPGKEKFRVQPIKELSITIDGKKVDVSECLMTPIEILALVGLNSEEYYLKQIKGKNEITYESDEDASADLHMRNNMKFTTCKRKVIIIVNGRKKEWGIKEISFREVVVLAFGNYDDNPLVCYTVTYTRGCSPKPQGSMVEDDSVCVKHKMIFNVSATDKS